MTQYLIFYLEQKQSIVLACFTPYKHDFPLYF